MVICDQLLSTALPGASTCSCLFSALSLWSSALQMGARPNTRVHPMDMPLQSCPAVRCLVSMSVAQVGVTVLSPHATIFSEHDRQQVKTARAQASGAGGLALFLFILSVRSAAAVGPQGFHNARSWPSLGLCPDGIWSRKAAG